MDTRLIDANGLVVVEECPYPKPSETIQHPTRPLAYRPLKGFFPELRLLDIGAGLGQKWYHVIVVEAVEPKDRPPAVKSLESDVPVHHKAKY